MLDRDLAQRYGVETKVFNQAVKRNVDRFPDEFRFQITKEEAENMRSQPVTLAASLFRPKRSCTRVGRGVPPSRSPEPAHSESSPYLFETGAQLLDRILIERRNAHEEQQATALRKKKYKEPAPPM